MSAGDDIFERIANPDAPCFVIAEAGVNHNGSVQQALALIDAATVSGVDAVKFQTFNTASLVSPDAPKARYQTVHDSAANQMEMLRKLELSPETHRQLKAHCTQRGITFLSSPFDVRSIDLLVDLDVELLKIGSGELTNHPLLENAARRGLPVILSTGMSTLDEVNAAVEVVRSASNDRLVLLHCVSQYPAPVEEVNLRAMATLAELGHPVGYSDHTLGIEIPIAAVALGARVIEKHFTLDRTLPGPDHAASLEPDELTAMMTAIRNVERSLGDGRKRPMPSEKETRRLGRRSLFAARDLRAGAQFQPDMAVALRPGDVGLSPTALASLIGRAIARDVAAGAPLTIADFDS